MRAFLLREDEGDDESVKGESLREDKNEDHAYVQLILLSHGAHGCVANNANSHASAETGEAAAESRSEVLVSLGGGETGFGDSALENNSDDKAVDTEDTRQNDGNNVLDDHSRVHDTHGHDADTSFCGTVRRPEVGKDEGRSGAHPSEKVRRGRFFSRHCFVCARKNTKKKQTDKGTFTANKANKGKEKEDIVRRK